MQDGESAALDFDRFVVCLGVVCVCGHSLLCNIGNRFSDFPNVLLSMPDLQTLGLGKNQLEDVPSNLGKMAELRELDLFMNRLRKLTLSEPVPKLHSLLLRANRLSELSESLQGLSALTHLDISNNAIESLMPLAKIPSLTRLECSSCRIANLNVLTMRETPLCQSIAIVNVSCNRQITSLVDMQTPNLIELRAMNCSIDRVASKLSSCKKLKILDLDGNPLRYMCLESPKLEILALCGSKLHEFPQLDAGSLIELASANTQLRRMPEYANAATASLRRLYLQRNNISNVCSTYLTSLTVGRVEDSFVLSDIFFFLHLSVCKSFLFDSTRFAKFRKSVFMKVWW